MASFLPLSGAISLNDINTAFGYKDLNSLRGKTWYKSDNSRITASVSGAVSMSSLYGYGGSSPVVAGSALITSTQSYTLPYFNTLKIHVIGGGGASEDKNSNAGGDGGTTSFGSYLSATGGGGGTSSTQGAGGTGTGGNVYNLTGSPGSEATVGSSLVNYGGAAAGRTYTTYAGVQALCSVLSSSTSDVAPVAGNNYGGGAAAGWVFKLFAGGLKYGYSGGGGGYAQSVYTYGGSIAQRATVICTIGAGGTPPSATSAAGAPGCIYLEWS